MNINRIETFGKFVFATFFGEHNVDFTFKKKFQQKKN